MSERDVPWGLLGVGGIASLCCLGSAAAFGGAAVGGAAVGGAAVGGALAGGLGASLVQILVTVVTVGVVAVAWRWRWRSSSVRQCGVSRSPP